MGNYIFINLFISILLEGFEEDEQDREGEEERDQLLKSKSAKILAVVRTLSRSNSASVKPVAGGSIDSSAQKDEEEQEERKDKKCLLRAILGKICIIPATTLSLYFRSIIQRALWQAPYASIRL